MKNKEDDELIKNFFHKKKLLIEDNGFTKEVMKNVDKYSKNYAFRNIIILSSVIISFLLIPILKIDVEFLIIMIKQNILNIIHSYFNELNNILTSLIILVIFIFVTYENKIEKELFL